MAKEIRVPKAPLTPVRIPLPKQIGQPFKDEKRYDRNKQKRELKKITERLDCVATDVEQINPALALAIDRISDHLEQRIACENPMLIENSLMKIDKDLKNMESWSKNIEVAPLRERLDSIYKSLSKHIEEIKEQFKR